MSLCLMLPGAFFEVDLLFHTWHIKVLSRGKFRKVGETITVQAGSVLELRCRGKPVQWGVPPYLEEDDDGRLK